MQSLSVDNTKLRDSEKKLIKEKIKLTRQCKVRKLHLSLSLSDNITLFSLPLQMLEVARDRAEDRLKIEQTQRDSVEKLRQRNKELEEQLRALCESQVSQLL